MAEQTHYSHAPITEAVIDLRVELDPEATMEQLMAVRNGLEAEYPIVRKQLLAKGQFSVGGMVASSAQQYQSGHVFTSADERYIWQVRIDGFTLSRLAPYDNWQSFSSEARKLWERYRNTVNLKVISRLAVRYINRLDLPLPLLDLSQYFRTYPEVSKDVPQQLAGFFMQLSIPVEDIRSRMNVTQTTIPSDRSDAIPVVLDIDVFRTQEVPQSEMELWRFFDDLRACKIKVFEASITDRTRELIA